MTSGAPANNFVGVVVQSDNVDALLRNMLLKLSRPRPLMVAVSGAVARLLVRNFRVLNDTRNKHGSNFYQKEGARATKHYAAPDGLSGEVVVHSRPMAHKLTGGTVHPINARSIAVPVSERAKRDSARGKTPAEISGLEFVMSAATRKPLLARIIGKGKHAKIEVEYVLLKSVTHKPHPETIPPHSAVLSAVSAACEDYAQNLTPQ